jgi:hypothetical protein
MVYVSATSLGCDHEYCFFSSVLEYLKIEKFTMFPGGALDQHEVAMTEDDATALMLENFGAIEDGNRLRKCLFGVGETDAIIGGNRTSTIPGCCT